MDRDPSINILDHSSISEKRITNQQVVEKELSKLAGTSIIERLTQIRQGLYGDLIENPVQIRTSDEHLSIGGFHVTPSSQEIATRLFPAYVKTIDTLYDFMLQKSSQDPDQVLRFCGLVYAAGIILHPYQDGNGQSLKLATLSYIHELLPHTSNYFFPTQKTLDKTTRRHFTFDTKDIPRIDNCIPVGAISNLTVNLDFVSDPLIKESLLLSTTENYSELEKVSQQINDQGKADQEKAARELHSQLQLTQMTNYLFDPENLQFLKKIIDGKKIKKTSSLSPEQKITIQMVDEFESRMKIPGQLEDSSTHAKNYN